MKRTAPPFRADHVGSLLRPPALKEARAKRQRNEITAEALRAIEDREIERAIKKQEEIGLKLATDGEFRRTWWHFDFFRGLDGVKFYLDNPEAASKPNAAETWLLLRASGTEPLLRIYTESCSKESVAKLLESARAFALDA